MTPNPVSLQDTLTLHEAIGVFVDRGISGAPVIDESGRPVGVLSQTDIMIHNRETVEHIASRVRCRNALAAYSLGRIPDRKSGWCNGARRDDSGCVRRWPAHLGRRVIEEMRELNVHRLFVVDGSGVLVGVISALDVLRKLDVQGER